MANLAAAGRGVDRIIVTAVTSPSPVPENNYGIQYGWSNGHDWVSWDHCQGIIPDTVVKLFTLATDGRVAIRRTPLVTWTDVDVPNSDIVDVQVISDTQVLMLVRGAPTVIYSWDGTSAISSTPWLTLADTWVEDMVPVGFRVVGNKLYIAGNTADAPPQPVVIVKDLRSGAPASTAPYTIELDSRYPHLATSIALSGTNAVAVGTDDGLGHGDLWLIAADDATLITAAVPGITALIETVDGAYLVGGDDGGVYSITALLHATSQDEVTGGYALDSTRGWVTTGGLGEVYAYSGTTWSTLGSTSANMSRPSSASWYDGRLWVGGDSDHLYTYSAGLQVWQDYATLTGWTDISEIITWQGRMILFGANAGGHIRTLVISGAACTGRYVDEVALTLIDSED